VGIQGISPKYKFNMANRAIVVNEIGGPEVLKFQDIPDPRTPGPGQVLVKHTTIGVNFMDIYYRKGVYKAPKLPMVPGMEACGVVEAVGPGVEIPIGTRVMYATAQTGAYCERRLINEKYLVGIPTNVTDDVAVAFLSKALTAHYLLFRAFMVKRGNWILVHAAAGAVGQMLCQYAKYMGVNVIGTVSTQEKANISRMSGCDYPIIYTQTDFVAEVNKITNGAGVQVVYDSVGKDTFAKSLQCLGTFGLMVSYGQSSGLVPPFNVLSLASKGLFLTRPTLMLYKSTKQELILSAIEVFKMLEEKVLRPSIYKNYPLKDAAQAHADIEGRKTVGSVILTV
jgi:NADPH2:quinone reductase